jgi:hypothetical protein
MLRGLVGLMLGAALATSGGVGTALAAKPVPKPIPAITGAACTYPGFDQYQYNDTWVSWEGLRPSRVEFAWYYYDAYLTVSVDHPKGTRLSVVTPVDGTDMPVNGGVTIYGTHGVELHLEFWCYQGY